MVSVEYVSTGQSNPLVKIILQFQCMRPLPPIQPFCICKLLKKFYENHLKDYGYGNDPFNYVLFLELSCIEIIEDLTKDESIEDQIVIHLLSHIED